MFTLIACALIILACSYKKPYSGDDEGHGEKPPLPLSNAHSSPEMESKIVIVMPGDTNPTYLARPFPPPLHIQQV